MHGVSLSPAIFLLHQFCNVVTRIYACERTQKEEEEERDRERERKRVKEEEEQV
ncbi:hypothetical protein E2C01_057259 [Portunus trituberculatus]|uniref:Uncharacterized protein n=1 Tax=Portunus trituberculatus TaxID=210409 RepID=A0A5B7H0K5_PORTR|nr:hypothetical protein [Portunus trituberculatus]